MRLTFDNPEWLWLLVLAVPVAWTGLRWFVSMSRVRRWTAVVARVSLLALVAALLAGAATVRETRQLAVVGVVDVSGSVRRFADLSAFPAAAEGEEAPAGVAEAARRWFEAAAAERGPDDLLGLVAFDGRAIAVATPGRGSVTDRSLDVQSAPGTDIAAALRYAAALIPPDAAGRIVLVSDGNQTAGDAAAAARELAARSGGFEAGPDAGGLPVDVIPLAYRVDNEIVVEAVDAPPRAPGESTVTVRVVIRSTGEASGTLRLTREGEPLDLNGPEPGTGRRVTLREGRNVELIEAKLDAGRIHRFEAIFEPDLTGPGAGGAAAYDTALDNNRAEAFTLTPGRGSVLILDGAAGGERGGAGEVLARTLRANGIEAEVRPAAGVPGDLLGLQAFDLVVLQNVPVEAVPERAQRALADYVRDLGGGLVMIGGPDSFGPGGWNGTPVADVLPVRLDLPEEIIEPEAAIVFVLDASGSMSQGVMGGSRSQQEVANEAAALAVQTLDRKDLVGVIAFNTTSRTVVPFGPNADPDATAAAIRAIAPNGGTNATPGLRQAHEWLRSHDAKIKHVIFLSDGQDQNSGGLPQIAANMRADGIRISTIAVGTGADTATLEEVARQGQGAHYFVTNPNVLPRILVKAVRVVRSPLVREQPFQPRVLPSGSPLTAGLPAEPPRLEGLVLTRPREEPGVTYAMATPRGEPLLAHWNVGLGQVVAFTSDASVWARHWVGTDLYARFWTQIARQTARADRGGNAELTTRVDGDELIVRVRAADDAGEPLDLLTIPATVYPPTGGPFEIRLSQVGPGAYEARAPARESGTFIVVARPMLGTQRLAPALGGASVSGGVEYRRTSSDVRLLREIAEATGGRLLDPAAPQAARLFDRSEIRPRRATTPIWPMLLGWTLLVFLLDVGTRRVAWDRFVSREFGVRPLAEAVAARRSETAGRLTGLRRQRAAAEAQDASTKLGEADAAQVRAAEKRRRLEARQAEQLARLRERKQQQAQGAADEGPSPAADLKPITREEVRRRQAEEARRRSADAGPAPAAPIERPEEPPAGEGPASLLAAKRRAAQRYKEGEP